MELVGYASIGVTMGGGSKVEEYVGDETMRAVEHRGLTLLLQMNPNPTT